MLKTQPAKESTNGPRIGLALAGGGPLGAIYELGALRALDEALDGINFNQLKVYVGVSAGAFMTACLANQFTPEQMCHIFIDNASEQHRLTPEVFLKPAFLEYFRRVGSVPNLLVDSLWQFIKHPQELGLFESLNSLSRAIPTGVFDNDNIHKALAGIYNMGNCTNDFRKLNNKLYLIATDLDTGEAVKFGAEGYDHIPISRAVQASAALPGLFPPVEIEGRYYVDGALLKTLHASVALDAGVDLVICINPLVPFDANLALRKGKPKHDKLVEGGLPMVLSQTFRAIIHSRMQVGMSKYRTQYQHSDVILFEPDRDDSEMFFANVFSYSNRHRVCEHAYQTTRKDLLARREQLETILSRHGITLKMDVLLDDTRHFSDGYKPEPTLEEKRFSGKLTNTLDELQQWVKKKSKRYLPQA